MDAVEQGRRDRSQKSIVTTRAVGSVKPEPVKQLRPYTLKSDKQWDHVGRGDSRIRKLSSRESTWATALAVADDFDAGKS